MVEDKLDVMFVSSECFPFIRTGGLGDVIGSLPNYLVSKTKSMKVVLPLYKTIKEKFMNDLNLIGEVDVKMSWRNYKAKVYSLELNKINYYFIEGDNYFDIEKNKIYEGNNQVERFAYFNIATLEMLKLINCYPDIIHIHDWQTAMIASLYKEIYSYNKKYENIKILLTIHNPAFQGMCDREALEDLFNLENDLFDRGIARFKGRVSTLKTGIMYADAINTVSPNNAREILNGFYSYDLNYILKFRKNDFYGILNGLDYKVYSPYRDKLIYKRFNFKTISKKEENKKNIQEFFKIDVNPNKLLCGVASRLSFQKGFDLIIDNIPWMLENNSQLVVIGSGEKKLEETLQKYRDKYPNNIGVYIGYDDSIAHKLYSSVDIYLMPSLFEPCGLSQMVAQRYGSVPVVREVGGLVDSVTPYNEFSKIGTGFSFKNLESEDFKSILQYASNIYFNKKEDWLSIVEQCMKQNNSWSKSAKEYLKLYQKINGKEDYINGKRKI